MEVGGQCHVPAALPSGEAQYHSIGGCVGPRVGLDRGQKISPLPGLDTRSVQFIASWYTD